MWVLFWPGVLAWVVIGVLFLTQGDALARAIGALLLAAWLVCLVRAYRRPATRERLAWIHRRSAPVLRHPLLRIAAAGAILVGALAGAAYLHWHEAVYHCPPESLVICTYTSKASWADPTALAILLAGIVVAAALVVTLRRDHGRARER